jgi:hypothetical protein
MYGTIARLHPRPGALEALREIIAAEADRSVAGFRAAWLVEPDQQPYDRPTIFLVAVFEDATTYRANADDPVQDAEYRRMRALLEDDPEWMDGTFTGAIAEQPHAGRVFQEDTVTAG